MIVHEYYKIIPVEYFSGIVGLISSGNAFFYFRRHICVYTINGA